jgi:hypothetical protein
MNISFETNAGYHFRLASMILISVFSVSLISRYLPGQLGTIFLAGISPVLLYAFIEGSDKVNYKSKTRQIIFSALNTWLAAVTIPGHYLYALYLFFRKG